MVNIIFGGFKNAIIYKFNVENWKNITYNEKDYIIVLIKDIKVNKIFSIRRKSSKQQDIGGII